VFLLFKVQEGGLPLINFAEISMWDRVPWGGYGANPYPHRITRIMIKAIRLMEEGYPPNVRSREKVLEVLNLVKETSATLPDNLKKSWHWQLLYLRAIIAVEIATLIKKVTIVQQRRKYGREKGRQLR